MSTGLELPSWDKDQELSQPLPDSVGQVKRGREKPEEMLMLSHVG